MHKTLREQHEALIKLKGMAPDNKIPKGLLEQGDRAISNALEAFSRAENADIENEKRPSVKATDVK